MHQYALPILVVFTLLAGCQAAPPPAADTPAAATLRVETEPSDRLSVGRATVEMRWVTARALRITGDTDLVRLFYLPSEADWAAPMDRPVVASLAEGYVMPEGLLPRRAEPVVFGEVQTLRPGHSGPRLAAYAQRRLAGDVTALLTPGYVMRQEQVTLPTSPGVVVVVLLDPIGEGLAEAGWRILTPDSP